MNDHRSADRGFTLVELIIVTTLTGLVVAVLSATLLVILRTTPGSAARVDDSRSYQGLVTWLPRDVASSADDGSGISKLDIPAPPPKLCTGITSDPGDQDLLQITWEENLGTPVTYVAIYRYEAMGSNTSVVRRYTCQSGNAASGIELTAPLSSSAPTVDRDLSSGHASVTMTFDTAANGPFITGGEEIAIEAATHNPNVTLPSTTLPSEPPVLTPCDATFQAASYGPVARNTDNPNKEKLSAAVSVTVVVTGNTCSVVELRYNTGVDNVVQTVTATGTAGTYVIQIPKGVGGPGTPKWTVGSHTLSIADNGSPLTGTATLAVT